MNEIEMNFKIIDKDGLLKYLRSLTSEKTQNIKMTYLGKHGDDSFISASKKFQMIVVTEKY